MKKALSRRLDEYVKLRQKVKSKYPAPKKTDDPSEIASRKEALARGIREARQGARQGDVFGVEVASCLEQIVRNHLTSAAKRAVQEGNPAVEGGAAAEAKVNAKYPTEAPLSTVPPSLLLTLPELPKGLEYRFIGKTMVLHDAEAGLIVDFIPHVTP